jgi:hypothetical protein
LGPRWWQRNSAGVNVTWSYGTRGYDSRGYATGSYVTRRYASGHATGRISAWLRLSACRNADGANGLVWLGLPGSDGADVPASVSERCNASAARTSAARRRSPRRASKGSQASALGEVRLLWPRNGVRRASCPSASRRSSDSCRLGRHLPPWSVPGPARRITDSSLLRNARPCSRREVADGGRDTSMFVSPPTRPGHLPHSTHSTATGCLFCNSAAVYMRICRRLTSGVPASQSLSNRRVSSSERTGSLKRASPTYRLPCGR